LKNTFRNWLFFKKYHCAHAYLTICTDNSVTSCFSSYSSNYSDFTFPTVRIFQFPAPNQEISNLKGTWKKKIRDTDKYLGLYLQPSTCSETKSLSRFGSKWRKGFGYSNGLPSSL